MNKIENMNIGIVGATGAVGREVIQILEERGLHPQGLHLAASEKSAGETIEFRQKAVKVQELTPDFFKNLDVAICSAGSQVSKEYIQPEMLKETIAIDNCSYHRMDAQVPLVIPEVNGFVLNQRPKKSIIANPNCTTIGMLVPLAAIHAEFPIQKIICSSYQSVSGAGQKGIEELGSQIQSMFQSHEPDPQVFPKRIAFNLIPEIGGLLDSGTSVEEQKMVQETKKILDDTIEVAATCVRVPTFLGHGLSMYVEVADPVEVSEILEILSSAPGVKVVQDKKSYPVLTDCQGNDSVYVGRVRHGTTPNSFQLWCVSDNLRKGAALNAVQILETIAGKPW